MKKLLMLFALVISFGIANAQRGTTLQLLAADSLINVDTTTKVFATTAGYHGIVISPIVTRISGTAAGKVYLSESFDGVNYSANLDSITLTNAVTNTGIWKRTPPFANFYRVQFISSGTCLLVPLTRFVARKYD
jgi:hypothetical protein